MKRHLFHAAIYIALVLFGLKLLVPKPELQVKSSYSQAIYDRHGELLRLNIASDERYRLWTALSAISPNLVKATIALEDRYFYLHPGVNPLSLFRAAYHTFVSRDRRYGASTITMQLARMRFGITSSNLSGKLSQILRALQLELHYSKEEILEAYLNLAPYGGNVEGAAAAALIYFGKDVSALSLPESLTLAVVPQNPLKRAPKNTSPELQQARDRLVAQLAPQQREEFSRISVPFGKSDLPFLAPHFVDRVLAKDRFEPRIRTTLDLALQHLLERQLGPYLERNVRLGSKNASILLLDSRNMEVLAYVGSADYFNSEISGYVDGVEGRRSPGSALKPFLYGLALDRGVIHPESVLKDVEYARAAYNPENFDGEFLGPLSSTDALIRSRNSPAVSLLNRVGQEQVYQLLKRAGVKELRPANYYGLSLALGGVETTLGELTSLYAALLRGGVSQPLRFVKDSAAAQHASSILTPEASQLVLNMLAHNPRPGSEADPTTRSGMARVPWKTGTSFGFRDAWALGAIGPYVLGVWIGNFDGTSNPAFIGRDAAGPLFFAIADALIAEHKDREPNAMPIKLNLKQVHVCAISGDLPGPHCKHTKEADFIPGVSPIKTCTVHREIAVNPLTGLRSCSYSPTDRREVFEFWPSDLLSLFRQVGLPRKQPPPFDRQCVDSQPNLDRPEIVSPRNGVEYMAHDLNAGLVPFSAVTSADSKQLYWFVNGVSAGMVKSGETLFWKARPGEFLVRAVDDQGRGNAAKLVVRLN